MAAVNEKGVMASVGDTLECISSASPGYKVGRRYEVQANEKGQTYLIGSDGFKDFLPNLVSKFVKVTVDATDNA